MLPIKCLRMRTPYERKNDRREWADRDEFLGVRPWPATLTLASAGPADLVVKIVGLSKIA
jgi:hypothetical protein